MDGSGLSSLPALAASNYLTPVLSGGDIPSFGYHLTSAFWDKLRENAS